MLPLLGRAPCALKVCGVSDLGLRVKGLTVSKVRSLNKPYPGSELTCSEIMVPTLGTELLVTRKAADS